MCGINGIYGLQDEVKRKACIVRMNTALAHRGPDDDGVYTTAQLALGHRRLSIIDLSSAGHQPMSDTSGRYTLTYNGEIYNFHELRTQLGGYPFKTNTDSEVILAAFSKWGKACVEKFNGMFAFAIWDAQNQELFIARDRLGIKPLYYYRDDHVFVFSSELRALLASECIPRVLDESSLADYLRYQTVHAPRPIIRDVNMLMPGHFILFRKTDFSVTRYWNPSEKTNTAVLSKSYSEVCGDIYQLLLNAVKRRLIADVPFGAFLSGGIDSSAVVALMSRVSSAPVKTFAVVFDSEKEFNEARYSRLIANKFNTEHHEIKLTANYFLDELPAALNAMDHPGGDGPNTYIVSQATRQAGITMALSGLGGDELFAGYDIFRRMTKLEKLKWLNILPAALRAVPGVMLQALRPGVSSEKIEALLSLKTLDFPSVYALSRQVLTDNRVRKILKTALHSPNAVTEIVSRLSEDPGFRMLPSLSRTSLSEISTYMQNVLLRDTDQMSMAHALEVRVPFLDYTLVEYVLSVPDAFKFPAFPKKLLVDALGDMLPPEIVHRPKMGFTFPWKVWMNNELRSLCEMEINKFSERSCVHSRAVKALWNSFLAGDPCVSWSRVWHIVVLEHWLSKNRVH